VEKGSKRIYPWHLWREMKMEGIRRWASTRFLEKKQNQGKLRKKNFKEGKKRKTNELRNKDVFCLPLLVKNISTGKKNLLQSTAKINQKKKTKSKEERKKLKT